MPPLPAGTTLSGSTPSSPWIFRLIATGFIVLGVIDTWRIHVLQGNLVAAQEAIRTRDWQVTEEAGRQSLADLRVLPLDAKDPAYGSAGIVVAWDARLHQGLITTQNLPAPPAGRDYQLWVLDPGEEAPVNAGLLAPGGGSRGFAVHPVKAGNIGFAVSLEPAGGSPEPTGPILFAVAPGP